MNSQQFPLFYPASYNIGYPSATYAEITQQQQQQQNPVAAAAIRASSLYPAAAALNPHSAAVGAAAAAAAAPTLNPGTVSLNHYAAAINPACIAALNPAAGPSSFNPAATASLNSTAASLSQLSEALSCMEVEKSKAYRKAVTCSPDLITKESNPILYLKFCKHDPWKAAKRLCAYWQLRYEIFGPERCYRPVLKYCSETGALSKVAMNVILETGHTIMLLPDDEGRTVVFLQKISRKSHTERNIQPVHKMEVAFYFMHLVIAQPNAVEKGCRGVFLLNERRLYPSRYPKSHKAVAKVMRDCFPIELVGLHVVMAPRISRKALTPSYSRRLVNSILPYAWSALEYHMGFTRLTLDLILVSTDDKKDLYEEKLSKLFIDKLKLNPNSIPVQAGGTWSWERFKEWFQIQQNILEQQGLPTVPVPILQRKRPNKNDEDSKSSRRNKNVKTAQKTKDSRRDSSKDDSSVNAEQPVEETDNNNNVENSGTKRKVSQQSMPSVCAMAALGALEPLPIWYDGVGSTTDQSSNTITGATIAHLANPASKRQR